MSVIPSEFAACPFPANSSNLIYALAQAQDWWSYWQLRALQPNLTHSQLLHRPFYRPTTSLSFTHPTPIQIGTEHYFEWQYTETKVPLVAFHLIIHLSEPVLTQLWLTPTQSRPGMFPLVLISLCTMPLLFPTPDSYL